MAKQIVVSGIRPTGFLHLGNYFGALRNFVRMQDEYRCFFFVADLHSLTTHPKPEDLPGHVMRVVAEYIASGLDPERAVLYVQSEVPETAELYLLLNMLAYKGELEKVPTFKEKIRQHSDNVNAGLLTYPVLMAADILLHRAERVPVGQDQAQHLEMARNFANRFNNRYGEALFPEPQPFSTRGALLKIGSLDGEGKMSKSRNEMSTIYLADSDDAIRQKFRKAKTAMGALVPGAPMPESVANLFTLLELVAAPEAYTDFKTAFETGNIRYGDLKQQLADDMIRFISPIREKAAELQRDTEGMKKIIARGAAQARESAVKTLGEVKRLMGLQYR